MLTRWHAAGGLKSRSTLGCSNARWLYAHVYTQVYTQAMYTAAPADAPQLQHEHDEQHAWLLMWGIQTRPASAPKGDGGTEVKSCTAVPLHATKASYTAVPLGVAKAAVSLGADSRLGRFRHLFACSCRLPNTRVEKKSAVVLPVHIGRVVLWSKTATPSEGVQLAAVPRWTGRRK